MDTNSIGALILVIIVVAIIVVYIAICYGVGRLAEKKGRGGCTWFFLSLLLLGPIIAFIIVSLLPETDAHRRKRIEEEELIKRRVWGSMNENPSWEAGKKESLIDKYREP